MSLIQVLQAPQKNCEIKNLAEEVYILYCLYCWSLKEERNSIKGA